MHWTRRAAEATRAALPRGRLLERLDDEHVLVLRPDVTAMRFTGARLRDRRALGPDGPARRALTRANVLQLNRVPDEPRDGVADRFRPTRGPGVQFGEGLSLAR